MTSLSRFRSVRLWILTWIVSTGLITAHLGISSGAQNQEKGYDLGPYEPVVGWPIPPDPGWTWGRTSSIWADTPDRVFVIQDGQLPILPVKADCTVRFDAKSYAPDCETVNTSLWSFVSGIRVAQRATNMRWTKILSIYDASGKLVSSWDHLNECCFIRPHSVRVDPYDRHVWIVDDGGDRVRKFTPDGQLVMTVGEPHSGSRTSSSQGRGRFPPANYDSKKHMTAPTDIAWLPNGDFFVSMETDPRIHKYSKGGKFLAEFGQSDVGSYHGLAVDARQRLYAVQRPRDQKNTGRVRVFDAQGTELDNWPNIPFPSAINVSRDQSVWVAEGRNMEMLKFSTDGRLLYSWGTVGTDPGMLFGPHGFSVDGEGNLYTAEVFHGRPQKFRPKRGADEAHLMQPPYPWFR